MAIRTAHNGSVEIAFETFGAAGGRPLLLVMGLDSPMQWWPDGFCAALAERGFHVARFDSRDCGRSTRYGESPGADVGGDTGRNAGWDAGRDAGRDTYGGNGRKRASVIPGLTIVRPSRRPPAYTAAEMISDGLTVMDALGWSSAHVVGASLGAGMTLGMAIRYPERVRTAVSVMGLPAGFRPGAALRYVSVPGFLRFARSGTRTAHSAWEDMNVQVETARMLASAGHPFDEQWAYATAAACRSGAPGDPGTALRQLAAMRADEGLFRRVAEIAAPLLVLHGADDPLFKPASAVALTKQVPGSKCVIYPNMGHEVPRHLWAEIADEIGRHAQLGDERLSRQHGHGHGAKAGQGVGREVGPKAGRVAGREMGLVLGRGVVRAAGPRVARETSPRISQKAALTAHLSHGRSEGRAECRVERRVERRVDTSAVAGDQADGQAKVRADDRVNEQASA